MASTKAELEQHRSEYYRVLDEARSAEEMRLYAKAVELAWASCHHIEGMMQFERKHLQKEFASIGAIDLVLKYAPLIFDFHHLDKLESMLKESRRIEKGTTVSLSEKLAKARAKMWSAHRLWDYLEQHPEVKQDELRRSLGGDQEEWRTITESWDRMGLLRRVPQGQSYGLTLSTRMGEVVSAKCPACGGVADGPKAMFLEKLPCPMCRRSVLFVLLLNSRA
jgi:hypothetical protein